MTYHLAMIKDVRELPDVIPFDDILAEQFAADPEFEEEWNRLALARAVSIELLRYRARHKLSQRGLAKVLGVSQPRVYELESGEKNPQVETLMKVSAATGIEFAIDIAPQEAKPTLAGRKVSREPAHICAGAAVRVACA